MSQVFIFTKFHEDWAKIVDFLQGAKKGTAEIIHGTRFNIIFASAIPSTAFGISTRGH